MKRRWFGVLLMAWASVASLFAYAPNALAANAVWIDQTHISYNGDIYFDNKIDDSWDYADLSAPTGCTYRINSFMPKTSTNNGLVAPSSALFQKNCGADAPPITINIDNVPASHIDFTWQDAGTITDVFGETFIANAQNVFEGAGKGGPCADTLTGTGNNLTLTIRQSDTASNRDWRNTWAGAHKALGDPIALAGIMKPDNNGCLVFPPFTVTIGQTQNATKPAGSSDASKSSGTGTAADTQPTCDAGGGFTWLICGAITHLLGIVDWIEKNVIVSFLKEEPLAKYQVDSNGKPVPDANGKPATTVIYTIWQRFRDVATVFFILIFFLTIFGTAIGYDNYTIKKVLPRLVAGAVLVPLSWYIATILIDIGNVAGQGILGLTSTLIPNPDITITSGTGAVSGVVAATVGIGVVIAAPVLASMALGVLLTAVISLLGVFFTLLFRKVLLLVLVVIAPFALVAWILPNTEKLYKSWMNNFIKLVMMYPMIMLLFEGGRLFSSVAGNIGSATPGGATAKPLFELVGLVLPLFLVPLMFNQAGKFMSVGAGYINKAKTGANNRWGKNSASSQKRVERAKQNAQTNALLREKDRPDTALGRIQAARDRKKAGVGAGFLGYGRGNVHQKAAHKAASDKAHADKGLGDQIDERRRREDGLGEESSEERVEAEKLAARKRELQAQAGRVGLLNEHHGAGSPPSTEEYEAAVIGAGRSAADERGKARAVVRNERRNLGSASPQTLVDVADAAEKQHAVDDEKVRAAVTGINAGGAVTDVNLDEIHQEASRNARVEFRGKIGTAAGSNLVENTLGAETNQDIEAAAVLTSRKAEATARETRSASIRVQQAAALPGGRGGTSTADIVKAARADADNAAALAHAATVGSAYEADEMRDNGEGVYDLLDAGSSKSKDAADERIGEREGTRRNSPAAADTGITGKIQQRDAMIRRMEDGLTKGGAALARVEAYDAFNPTGADEAQWAKDIVDANAETQYASDSEKMGTRKGAAAQGREGRNAPLPGQVIGDRKVQAPELAAGAETAGAIGVTKHQEELLAHGEGDIDAEDKLIEESKTPTNPTGMSRDDARKKLIADAGSKARRDTRTKVSGELVGASADAAGEEAAVKEIGDTYGLNPADARKQIYTSAADNAYDAGSKASSKELSDSVAKANQAKAGLAKEVLEGRAISTQQARNTLLRANSSNSLLDSARKAASEDRTIRDTQTGNQVALKAIADSRGETLPDARQRIIEGEGELAGSAAAIKAADELGAIDKKLEVERAAEEQFALKDASGKALRDRSGNFITQDSAGRVGTITQAEARRKIVQQAAASGGETGRRSQAAVYSKNTALANAAENVAVNVDSKRIDAGTVAQEETLAGEAAAIDVASDRSLPQASYEERLASKTEVAREKKIAELANEKLLDTNLPPVTMPDGSVFDFEGRSVKNTEDTEPNLRAIQQVAKNAFKAGDLVTGHAMLQKLSQTTAGVQLAHELKNTDVNDGGLGGDKYGMVTDSPHPDRPWEKDFLNVWRNSMGNSKALDILKPTFKAGDNMSPENAVTVQPNDIKRYSGVAPDTFTLPGEITALETVVRAGNPDPKVQKKNEKALEKAKKNLEIAQRATKNLSQTMLTGFTDPQVKGKIKPKTADEIAKILRQDLDQAKAAGKKPLLATDDLVIEVDKYLNMQGKPKIMDPKFEPYK